MRQRVALVVAAALVVVVALAVRGGGKPAPALEPGALRAGLSGDALAWDPERSPEYADRAAAGLAHVLYAKSPGGMLASARAVASWRPLIDRVAKATGADAATIEGIVLLESAGRAEAQASNSLEGAVGLTQILAETGRDLLGMRVDVAASTRLTRRIARAHGKRAQRLRARRRRVDERFDPRRALAATARYLAIARARLGGRADLAVAAYHMGIGNMQTALSLYGAPGGVPYVRLFFDATPQRHAPAQRFLSRLGDDSSTYLWRVRAAEAVMALLRSDPKALARQQALQTASDSAEVALHPPQDTKVYSDDGALGDGYSSGDLVELPAAYLRAHGIAVDDPGPARRRGLRREALATLAYIGAQVREISGSRGTLRVTRAVLDAKSAKSLPVGDPEAGDAYDLHTTGYAFDIARRYSGHGQALAFQYVLDRLTALNLIAWVREPSTIHVTVANDASRLEAPMGIHP